MQNTGSTSRGSLSRRTIAAIGGLAVVAGIGVGGLAIANAQDAPSSDTGTSQEQTKGRHGEKGGKGEMGGRGDMAETLAEALGMDVETVEQALTEVREEARADRADGPPSEADREAREQQRVDALASKLGVDPQDITSALEQARSAKDAERTAALSEKLNEAVAAGTITEADATGVLNAFEAGVLGGPGGMGGPGGHGGPGGEGGRGGR